MKLIISVVAIAAVVSARRIYNEQQQLENYRNAAETYQSAADYPHESYADHSQAYKSQQTESISRPLAEKTAKILHYHLENNDHNYNYGYETENGIKAKEIGQTQKGTKVEGAYSYTGDDGQVYTVTYTADEHGFRAQGAHLPKPLPVPEAILKSLEQNAKDEANGIFDDGHYKDSQNQDQNYQLNAAAYQQNNYHAASEPINVVETGYH
ncbi:unnamed protein product [Parnassius apollo]|uniref:(apollo) hypothetical protein n=1 Tax=Parnassius apollo TaxID=110799 RepID=A0A8S3XB23_PARAO|nr:unnamed protein product [Parnassius apollo]